MICDNKDMDAIVKLLKEKGQRFTSQKRQVFCALKHKPQTVLEIFTALKAKNYGVDKVTIYRILTSFVQLELVKEINLGGREVRYELEGDGHHHHLVCEECGDIEDVELSESILMTEVQKKSKFKINRHSLEFFGTCSKCQ